MYKERCMRSGIRWLILKYGKFEIFYMSIMVIYMAQATLETSRMVGGISGNPVPLLLPMVFTYILCKKHPISFKNKNLHFVLVVYGIWAICSFLKLGIISTQELSYHFFMFYAIIIAYIHNQIFGYNLLPIYENIITFFSKIAIVGWLIGVLVPPSASFFRLFPETAFGNNILYLFNWMDPEKGQIYSGLLRNAGCSWEPGRFAVMIVLAIFCNLCNEGIKFRGNKNIVWLLISLITTQSTTGFFATIVIYSIFLIKKFDLKYVALYIIVMIPIIYAIMQFDFMGDKVANRLSNAQDFSRLYEQFDYHSGKEEDGAYLGSIDRFEAMVFEWLNFIHDPLLGYGRNFRNSYFYSNITTNYSLANGLMNILSCYGIFLGTFFFFVLYKSSASIARDSYSKKNIALFVLVCMCAVSYQILSVPVFTSFWFYGLFKVNRY